MLAKTTDAQLSKPIYRGNVHQADHAASHNSLDAGNKGIQQWYRPEILPIRFPPAQLHQERGASSPQVEQTI